jgi:hypothetical protein
MLLENVYNIDETGIMLSMLESVKVLLGRDDVRGHRGASIKRTTIPPRVAENPVWRHAGSDPHHNKVNCT